MEHCRHSLRFVITISVIRIVQVRSSMSDMRFWDSNAIDRLCVPDDFAAVTAPPRTESWPSLFQRYNENRIQEFCDDCLHRIRFGHYCKLLRNLMPNVRATLLRRYIHNGILVCGQRPSVRTCLSAGASISRCFSSEEKLKDACGENR